MPKYSVVVKGILNARGAVEVEADSMSAASKQVIKAVEMGETVVDWQFCVVCSAEEVAIKEIKEQEE